MIRIGITLSLGVCICFLYIDCLRCERFSYLSSRQSRAYLQDKLSWLTLFLLLTLNTFLLRAKTNAYSIIMKQSHFFAALFTIISILSACGDSNSFEKTVRSAIKDGNVDETEWRQIIESAQQEGQFLENGEVSKMKLSAYIQKYPENNRMRGVEQVNFSDDITLVGDGEVDSNKPIVVKFFLERSGSMIPYDGPKTRGDFKAAISGLLNNLPGNGSEKNLLYVVNNAVYPYGKTFKDFLQSKDIFGDTKNIGDPRYTDFTCIFDSILTHTKDNELSILASDLIYSTKDQATTTAQRILQEAKAMTTAVFKGHSDKDVIVIKLNSDYIGNYYPYNSPNKGKAYSGNRPFYLVMVANPNVIHRIFFDDEYKAFSNFKSLKGFEDYYCFTNSTAKPDYSVILSDKRNKGRFNASRGSSKTITSIEDIKPDRDGDIEITIAVDMSNIITSAEYKLDDDNYEIESISGFEIESIEELTKADRTPSIEKYAPNATHLIVISAKDKVMNEKLTIRLKNKLPEWIEETNADDDTNLNDDDFEDTTFAFQNLMLGIYESFFSNVRTPDFYDITFNINN